VLGANILLNKSVQEVLIYFCTFPRVSLSLSNKNLQSKLFKIAAFFLDMRLEISYVKYNSLFFTACRCNVNCCKNAQVTEISVCIIHPSILPSVIPPIHPSIHLSVCLYVSLSSLCVSVSISLPFSLSLSLSLYIYIYIYTHTYTYLVCLRLSLLP